MELHLEIIDGLSQGHSTELRDGLTLGRQGCDVNIEDSKVSSKHARIEKREDGRFWLIDTDSANGIRASGKRRDALLLELGVRFRLGQTRFQIQAGRELGAFEAPTPPSAPSRQWRDHIVHLSERGVREADLSKKRDSLLEPFPSALRLSFKKGMQAGTDWILGYGPREIGSSSVDLPLFEPGLPPKCFQISMMSGDVLIRVVDEARGKILLNGQRFESASLKSGDVLDIGNTRIEISFEN